MVKVVLKINLLCNVSTIPGRSRLQWYGLQHTVVEVSLLVQYDSFFKLCSPFRSGHRQIWQHRTWGATCPRRPRRMLSLGNMTHSVISTPRPSTACKRLSKSFSFNRFSMAWVTAFSSCKSCSLSKFFDVNCPWLRISFEHWVSFCIRNFHSFFTRLLRFERNIKHGQSGGGWRLASSSKASSLSSSESPLAKSQMHSTVAMSCASHKHEIEMYSKYRVDDTPTGYIRYMLASASWV